MEETEGFECRPLPRTDQKPKTGVAPDHIKQMIITKAVSWVAKGIYGAKIVDASIIEKKGKQQLRHIFKP